MGIGSMNKMKATKVIGIDASTNSLAFAIFDDGKPVRCGEVFFEGSTVFDRLLDAKKKTRALVSAGILQGDYVAIEASVMVRNIETAIDLAYVYGAIIGELMVLNPQVHKVYPISWQSGIGNPNLKTHEKDKLKKDYPDKSKSWYLSKGREMRKQRTLEIARKYFKIADGSDNVGDAVGLALFTSQTLTKR